jgi:hypothetical protein
VIVERLTLISSLLKTFAVKEGDCLMSEEEKSFTVKDHRRFNADGSSRSSDEDQTEVESENAEAKAQASTNGEAPNQQTDAEAEVRFEKARAQDEPAESGQGQERGPLPPVEFSGLILSLSHAAMMHLGQIPDPNTGQANMDRDLARHTIDTIGMLKEKTEGNLTPEEQRLIDHALTELRLAYVRLNR